MSVGTTGGRLSVKIKQTPKVFVNQSGLVIRKLGDLADVDLTAKEDGAILIYDQEKDAFVASRVLRKQFVDGGTF